MKPILSSVLTLWLALMASAALANTKDSDNTYLFQKQSTSLEMEVLVEVIVPESYATDPARHYPVVYMLDGFWTKAPLHRFYSNLRFDNMIPEAILVSLSYPDSVKDVAEQRMWDLTPVYDKHFKVGGHAVALIDLLKTRVIPTIESKYRIDTSRKVLTGHSLAGLFTLFTAYQAPELFTHYAAISPSALWADEWLLGFDAKFAKRHNSLPANVYITYGTDEYTPYVNAIEKYLVQLQARDYQKLALTLASVAGMRHVSMQNEGFLRGLVWSFQDIKPEGPSEFEKMNLKALVL